MSSETDLVTHHSRGLRDMFDGFHTPRLVVDELHGNGFPTWYQQRLVTTRTTGVSIECGA